MADPGKPADMSWLPDAKVAEALGKQNQEQQVEAAAARESQKFNGGVKGSTIEADWASMNAILGVSGSTQGRSR